MRITIANTYKRFSEDVRQLNPELFGELGIDVAKQSDSGAAMALFNDVLKADKSDRGNKYGARRVNAEGRIFDSRAEYRHWLILRAQEEVGEITGLIHQCKIILLDGFAYRGQKVQQISYKADFTFVKDGVCHIQDLKSVATTKTEAFRIRWRLLLWMYKDRDDVVCEIILS